MVTGVFFGLIILLYVYAVFSAFEPIESVTDYGELVAFVLTPIGGLAVFALGYASVVVLGGKASLRLAEFISSLNKSKHAIEIMEETEANSRSQIRDASWTYIPALVFIISFALAWDIHYLRTTIDISSTPYLSSMFNLLSVFDIFLKAPSVGYFLYSIPL